MMTLRFLETSMAPTWIQYEGGAGGGDALTLMVSALIQSRINQYM
jgi:hypothetical protein